LSEKGKPIVHGAETHPNAPGLRFIGFSNPISGNLREMAIDSKKIARAVARELAGARSPAGAPALDHLEPLEDRGVVAG
jgi:putative flavoprotein involved in K+ transport